MNPFSPIKPEVAGECLGRLGIASLSRASIREIVRLSSALEKETGIPFIHMEMGIPGLPPCEIGTRAEIEALEKGVASKYPSIEGIPQLKDEVAKFARLFLDIDVPPQCCVPSAGAMQGTFATFMTSCRRDRRKDTTLFLDPGFPVQKQQHKVLGLNYESFDVYNFRGAPLWDKLRSCFDKGDISTVVFSNPNNPSWICLTDRELETIGSLCSEYDVVAVEDLAYFAMDFRKDFSRPGVPPYQPTVAKFTDNYVIIISSSKIFSYAGQRIGSILVSEKLFRREFPDLSGFFGTPQFGHALVYGALYALSSGTSHSAQAALAAMLKAANEGSLDITAQVREYGERARLMKKIFTANGFQIVYARDGDEDIAHGFYFTVAYPGMDSEQLLRGLLAYGITAISLDITGSSRNDGIRACVSLTDRKAIAELERRISAFNEKHTGKEG